MIENIEVDWAQVVELRKAVIKARNLPERIQAICAYQGALHIFVDRYSMFLDLAIADAGKKVA